MGEEMECHKRMGRPKKKLNSEQRARREIANSNERRRMQCINNGFHCLRQILKQHNSIEKHSKAAILHECANYIRKLENDINHFTQQNQMLKNFIDSHHKHNSVQQTDTEGCAEDLTNKEEHREDSQTYIESITSMKSKFDNCLIICNFIKYSMIWLK